VAGHCIAALGLWRLSLGKGIFALLGHLVGASRSPPQTEHTPSSSFACVVRLHLGHLNGCTLTRLIS
jgi:hypothetical protein